MIYCVWYPSGGFGHFVNAVLTLHGKNFARPRATQLNFSNNGNSHDLDLVVPKYLHDPDHYSFDFDPALNYSVLIDNGINNEGTRYRQSFPSAVTVKICYSDWTWPVVARTMIEKAMNLEFDQVMVVDNALWPEQEPWAQREKYFLYLRDHHLRCNWRPATDCQNMDIKCLLNYQSMHQALTDAGIVVDSFENLWQQWRLHNNQYIDPIEIAHSVVGAVQQRKDFDLQQIKDIWTQSVIYYYIWLLYGFEVPHNDHANWFTNTKEIVTMLDKHGVSIDSNT
jgi:hypothetical protein